MAGTQVAPGVVWMSRTEFGFPATVFSTDGHTHRPKLNVPTRWLTLHYTGSPRAKTTKTVNDVIAEMQAIERNAIAEGKSNEYNYAIFALSDGRAVIAEYAGTFRAAHSEGENADAVGVLFNLGCTKVNAAGFGLEFQAVPDAMIRAYRFLRDEVLRKFAVTNLNTLEVLHKDMPDASTQCPGDSVVNRMADLLAGNATIEPLVEDDGVEPAVFANLPPIAPGARGEGVKRAQGLLLALGFDPGDLDGKYTKSTNSPTRRALVGFQSSRGLPANGTIALRDWAHLLGVN